jgi:hypothetical protein
VEAIYLVCGAGGPQLKRNPLGCTAHSMGMYSLPTPTDSATLPDYLSVLGIFIIFASSIFSMGLSWKYRPRLGSTPAEARKYTTIRLGLSAISLSGIGLLWLVAVATGQSPLNRCTPHCAKVWVIGIILPIVALLLLPLWDLARRAR